MQFCHCECGLRQNVVESILTLPLTSGVIENADMFRSAAAFEVHQVSVKASNGTKDGIQKPRGPGNVNYM